MSAINTFELPSMEEKRKGKYFDRRFLLCTLAEIAGIAKMFSGNTPASLGEFTALTTVVLGAYYVSGYHDRKLAVRAATGEGQQNELMNFGDDISGYQPTINNLDVNNPPREV